MKQKTLPNPRNESRNEETHGGIQKMKTLEQRQAIFKGTLDNLQNTWNQLKELRAMDHDYAMGFIEAITIVKMLYETHCAETREYIDEHRNHRQTEL